MTSFQQSSSISTVERLHSTLTEIYRIIFAKRKEGKLNLDHEEILSETVVTYNNATHSSTNLTPFELFAVVPTFSQKQSRSTLNTTS